MKEIFNDPSYLKDLESDIDNTPDLDFGDFEDMYDMADPEQRRKQVEVETKYGARRKDTSIIRHVKYESAWNQAERIRKKVGNQYRVTVGKAMGEKGDNRVYFTVNMNAHPKQDYYEDAYDNFEDQVKILNNGNELNLSESNINSIHENYVKLMGRKRDGKELDRKSFQKVFENLQVFNYKDTYVFGEWDIANNIFKGRLISSPNIRELYGGLDKLLSKIDFTASVPEDMGKMLEKKGLYKLNVDKFYNFKGEDMIKNMYFTNESLVQKIFKKDPDEITKTDVERYDEFYNYWALINKLKQAYQKSKLNPKENTIEIFKILKEIGIYDYNAYRIASKINSNTLDENEVQNVIQIVINNSKINKVAIDKSDLLNNPKIYNDLNNELNTILAAYLSKFGIKTEILEDIQNKLGIDSFAHVDILNKILYVDKNNQTDYPQQAGKVIAFMMQHNPLVAEITSAMKRKSMFKHLNNDELLEAVGDLISEELHNRTSTKIPKSLSEAIKNLISQFFKFLNSIKINRINRNIGIIADNVLLQNQSLITQSKFKPGAPGDPISQVNLEEALNKDTFANEIVKILSPHFILTGSVVLAEQGTIYRPSENLVHDLDWVSPISRENGSKLIDSLFPNNVYIREILDGNNMTDTWLIPPKGHTIANLKLKGKNNKIVSYDIINKQNEIVNQYNGVTDTFSENDLVAKTVDIFSTKTIPNIKYITKNINNIDLRINNWTTTFEAKLKFGRLKDIWDYNRFIPNQNKFNNELDSKIDELLNSGEIKYVNEEGKPCAEMGLKTSNFQKGGKWKVVKQFKGSSHAQGGIDIEIGGGKVKLSNKKGKFEAKYGLVIPKIN